MFKPLQGIDGDWSVRYFFILFSGAVLGARYVARELVGDEAPHYDLPAVLTGSPSLLRSSEMFPDVLNCFCIVADSYKMAICTRYALLAHVLFLDIVSF
jgi:hypothetical protein